MNRYLSKEESTALKGVAILWMIFHHCYHETGLFDYLNLNFYPFDMESVLNVGIYAKVCVAIFAFVSSWNNYFIPALVLSTQKKKTLPILIASLRSADFLKFDMGKVYMLITIAIVPIIFVYILLSKFIVEGVTLGGVKE